MVLVDVFVPSIGQIYDFQLDENTKICMVIVEIVEMIEKKERTAICGESDSLELCDRRGEQALSKEWTLADYGIADGASLILV